MKVDILMYYHQDERDEAANVGCSILLGTAVFITLFLLAVITFA